MTKGFKEQIRHCAKCKKKIEYHYDDYVIDYSRPKGNYHGKMLCIQCDKEVNQ